MPGTSKGIDVYPSEQSPVNTASESEEGTLTLVKRSYVSEGNRVTAYFANGVLIDFAIGPQ